MPDQGRERSDREASGRHRSGQDPSTRPADEVPAPPPVPEFSPLLRRTALSIAALRYLIPLLAIPLIPLLILNRLPLLILLRPTKDFLLFAGARARVLGEPSLWLVFAAYVPLMIVAVWSFFLVGRIYRGALRTGDGPAWLSRAVPPAKLEIAQRVLAKRGPAIAVLGRIAALPPTVLAAAAGISDVDARRYLLADAIGGVVSFAIVVGAGFGLGRAYQEGGVWLTALGVALFVTLLALLTRWIRGEARAPAADAIEDATQDQPADG